MRNSDINRILIVRTDKIGDMVLSTPVITALRKAFPYSYIAMMVSPETQEIVEQNLYLNEVMVYDKKIKHRGIFRTMLFALWIRKKRFDVAFILHSTNRVHIICFLASVPRRVGYARGKLDFLLTDKLKYTKCLGEKHESEYSLDVVRALGIKAEMSPPKLYIKDSDIVAVQKLLKECGLEKGTGFAVVHPSASCPSRRWPIENFAKVSDILIEEFNLEVILVSSPEEIELGRRTKEHMRNKPLFLCGRTTLGELMPLLKKARLFISNDSGPVHIACAVGTPTITIFGRNERGLSPNRWRGIGSNSVVLHKDVGCEICLAHNCKKGFLCLKAVTVDEVIEKARGVLRDAP